LRWCLRAVALAASPPVEAVRIARSDRITGLRTQALALACLTRVRLYRSRRMLGLGLGGGSHGLAESWRQQG